MRTRLRVLFLIMWLIPAAAAMSQDSPSPEEPLFQERPFGPRPEEAPSIPPDIQHESEFPIPLEWQYAGLAVLIVAGGGLLLFASRRWRSWNLFDREYRFPVEKEAALRLGATKCGGHMAIAKLGLPPRPRPSPGE